MAVIFSSDLVLSAKRGGVFPLTHARIMYDNLVTDSTVIASAVAGFDSDAVQSYDTYDRWMPPSVPASLRIDFGSAKSLDYIFIASHNLGSTGAAFVTESSIDGVTWTPTNDEQIRADNNAIALLFENRPARYIRLRITSALATPKIGVIMAGLALQMQRPIYGGHTPITLSRETEIRPSTSEGGQWLGRSVVRRGYVGRYSWQHLTADWVREFFSPFIDRARFQPFGIAWRPGKFPTEAAYVWTDGDIRPSNMGIKDYMQVDMNVIGYDSGDI